MISAIQFKKLNTKTIIFIFIIYSRLLAYSFEIVQQLDGINIIKDGETVKEINTNSGNLKFILNKNKFDVFSNTNLNLSKDQLYLADGEMRVTVENFEVLKIMTPVGVVSILNNGDYILLYHNQAAKLTVVVLEGSALVQGHYREETLNLQIGESGGFSGVKEADGPAFDILLKGRKSVRGNLFGPDKISDEQKLRFVSQYNILLKPKVIKVSKSKPKPGEICEEPFAKFNECIWRCESENNRRVPCEANKTNLKCIRERCLANGEWGDKMELKGDLKAACNNKKSKVEPCEY